MNDEVVYFQSFRIRRKVRKYVTSTQGHFHTTGCTGIRGFKVTLRMDCSRILRRASDPGNGIEVEVNQFRPIRKSDTSEKTGSGPATLLTVHL